jgi:SAM-dependent methyltransferase
MGATPFRAVSGLVYHVGALGDFVTALPAIAAWRRLRADAEGDAGHVVLLGRPVHAALAAGIVDEVWDAGGARFASLFGGAPSSDVRALLAGVGSALVFAKEGAGIVRGLERAGVRDIVRGDPFPRGHVHIVDHHLSLFPNLELSPEERLPRIPVPEGSGPATAADAERSVVIHPGSGSPSKTWPLDRFAALAGLLGRDTPVAWVLGPAEEQSGIAAEVGDAVPGARAWRDLPLPELARRLAGSRLLVDNDSGVAHLAAACGCPVVVLFGASDPGVWAPRGASVTVVGDGACGMAAIGLDAVTAACRGILAAGLRGDDETIRRYDRDAKAFSERYETAELPRLHAMLLRNLPPQGASVLELGCGSGRDAAFLLSKGYEVTAIDASAGMVAEAGRLHPELVGRISCAAVPLPAGSPLVLRAFDAVFSNAMFMHLCDEDLRRTALQIRRMLHSGGVLVISVSVGREGLRGGRDGTGRLFLERPPKAYRQLFEGLGFSVVDRLEEPDSRERPGIRWVSMVLRCA